MATSITVEGEIIDLSGKGNDDYGFCYATHRNDPSIDDNKISKGKPQIGNFTSNIEGLSLNTLYYVRAYCQSAEGIVYGTTITVTTLDGTKTLSTTTPTDITATSALCGGNIANDGGSDITARGLVYYTSPHPTIENNIGKTVNGSPSKNCHYHPNTRQKYINKSNLKIYFGYVFFGILGKRLK